MKTLIQYITLLSFTIAPLAMAEEQKYDLSLSSEAASYQNGEQSWYEYLASWGSWATEKASLVRLFGAQAVKLLLNGIWSLAKDYAVGEVSKYATDLLSITAGAIISNYLELGTGGTVLTSIVIKQLSKKILASVKSKMAEIGKPITDQVAGKVESIVDDILAIPK